MSGMASSETPSLRHGVRVQPDPGVPVEAVLLAIGECVGHANLSHASRMNRGLLVFLKEERLVAELVASGVTVDGVYLQVSPLAVPSTRVTLSGVPPFIPNQVLERELLRFGKLASGFRSVGLGCKSDKLKHVQSFRRQVSMFLTCPSQTLEVSFRVKHGEGHYMIYANTGSIKCFLCGGMGHKRDACPHKPAEERAESEPAPAEGLGGAGAPMDDEPAGGDAPPAETGVEVSHGRQVGSHERDQSPTTGINTAERRGVEEKEGAEETGAEDRTEVREGVKNGEREIENTRAEELNVEVERTGEEERGVAEGISTKCREEGRGAEEDENQEAKTTSEDDRTGVEMRLGAEDKTSEEGKEESQKTNNRWEQREGKKDDGKKAEEKNCVGEEGAETEGVAHCNRAGEVGSSADPPGGMGGGAPPEKEEEAMDCDSESDNLSDSGSMSADGDVYSLEEINSFLDDTFGKSIKVLDYFPDGAKFIRTAVLLQKVYDNNSLDKKKRFRLKKHVTILRKIMERDGVKGSKRLRTSD